jgi:polyphosphate kinase 2 (PPK2 family)
MGKKGDGDTGKAGAAKRATASRKGEISGKDYAREMKKLHVELVKLQEWVKAKGLKVCIVFEGRDGAGKGGTIKAITERVSPRVFRVVALTAPSEREKSQMYIQRYLPYLPAAGEIVIFDRSWYNRAGVERYSVSDVLKDGTRVTIRAVRPGVRQRFLEAFRSGDVA